MEAYAASTSGCACTGQQAKPVNATAYLLGGWLVRDHSPAACQHHVRMHHPPLRAVWVRTAAARLRPANSTCGWTPPPSVACNGVQNLACGCASTGVGHAERHDRTRGPKVKDPAVQWRCMLTPLEQVTAMPVAAVLGRCPQQRTNAWAVAANAAHVLGTHKHYRCMCHAGRHYTHALQGCWGGRLHEANRAEQV
jgi:hypothetical protein